MTFVNNDERVLMGDIYVMQRANGDVFALDYHGRFRVPLFHSSRDAILARLRNFGMLLFKPVMLNASLLKQIVPVGGAAELEFWLIEDPLINLNHGRLIQHAQLALLVRNGIKLTIVSSSATSDEIGLSASPQSNGSAAAAWEDADGRYSKVA